MSTLNPEIDILLEFLEDEPADEAYAHVSRTLAAAGELDRAVDVVLRALQHGVDNPDDARLLASWAADIGRYDAIGAAAEVLDPSDFEEDPSLSRAWALYLESKGELVRASELARRLLKEGSDPELQGVIDRSEATAPDPLTRGVDPFLTASRAEAYVDMGRCDLAIRVLRRILAHRPDDVAIQARLVQLRAQQIEPRPWVEDLSEEYWVNRPMGPLIMPTSQLSRPPPAADPFAEDVSTEQPTDPDASSPVHATERVSAPGLAEDEATQVFRPEDLKAVAAQLRSESEGSSSSVPDDEEYDDIDDEATQVFSPEALAKLAEELAHQSSNQGEAFDPDEEATQVYRPPRLDD
ncbi:MAG: tetratricopeptide repeat protein [Deltaproteobacteria bacterium]|nr:MAG: tetratricopeptide repeat protein [Deltaproteobacteria bacterium]